MNNKLRTLQVEEMQQSDGSAAEKKILNPAVLNELLTQKLLCLDNLDVSGK